MYGLSAIQTSTNTISCEMHKQSWKYLKFFEQSRPNAAFKTTMSRKCWHLSTNCIVRKCLQKYTHTHTVVYLYITVFKGICRQWAKTLQKSPGLHNSAQFMTCNDNLWPGGDATATATTRTWWRQF